jgi:hypothetical protein
MRKTVWTFGLISGAILSMMMLLTVPFEERIGASYGEVVGYTTMVLAGLLIYFGVRSYRDNVGGGTVSFGRALAIGSLIVAISSVCYTATWEVYYRRYMPDFAEKYSARVVEKTKASGATQAQIDAKTAEMARFTEMYKNPVMNAAMTFVEPLPVGLIIALISAGVLSRKRRDGRGMDAGVSPALSS